MGLWNAIRCMFKTSSTELGTKSTDRDLHITVYGDTIVVSARTPKAIAFVESYIPVLNRDAISFETYINCFDDVVAQATTVKLSYKWSDQT